MPHPNYRFTERERFLMKCRHDPVTGCVNWIGATSKGRGKRRPYGRIKIKGKSVYSHRWAAVNLLGIALSPDEHIDHMCGNTLCQLHLQASLPLMNVRLYWLRVQVGLEPEPDDAFPDQFGMPFYSPPIWLENAPDYIPPLTLYSNGMLSDDMLERMCSLRGTENVERFREMGGPDNERLAFDVLQ
jgi:hypothetical protein